MIKDNIVNSTLKSSVQLIRKCTQEQKLLSFHLKVIHRIINVGVNLKKWGIKDSNLCRYCPESDSVLHALFYCPKTQEWLGKLFNVINIASSSITLETVVFGSHDLALNLILLIAKRYVLHIRNNNFLFNIDVLLKDIHMRVQVDKKCTCEDLFTRKWGKYIMLH